MKPIKKPTLRTRFDRRSPMLLCPRAERRTKSEFKQDCDINLIMARYHRTGILPDTARAAAARYGDFSGVPGYHDMMNRTLAAQELFEALPATARKAFGNDPGRFLVASQTPEGQRLLVKLGLATARPEPLTEDPAPVPPKKSGKPADDPAGGDRRNASQKAKNSPAPTDSVGD